MPKWYHPTIPPSKPTEPEKTCLQNHEIGQVELSSHCSIDIPEGTQSVYAEAIQEYDMEFIKLICYKHTTIPNPDYDDELARYKAALIIFEEQMEEWEKLKKIYDKEQEDLTLAAEKAQYEKLKKKFEK